MSNNPTTTFEVLIQSAEAALSLQNENGSFPAGRAGAYDYPMTPVRTTGSWLLTLSKAYELTEREEFSESANEAIDYLLTREARPFGYTFHARRTDDKDRCDGLVGQAAPIDGLTYSSKVFNRPEAQDAAKEVFSLLPFDEQLGLWKRIEIDGTELSYDRTLNHQIIFAESAISLANEFDSVNRKCMRFLERLPRNLDLHDDGLPRHYIRPPLRDVLSYTLRNPLPPDLLWNELAIRYHAYSDTRRRKEIGYYPVITSKLANLKRAWPGNPIWESPIIEELLGFLESQDYQTVLEGEISFGSVNPLLNHAMTNFWFNRISREELGNLLEKVVENEFNPESKLLTGTATDPEFEATAVNSLRNLPNVEISPEF